MKWQIKDGVNTHELQIEPITQLCGTNYTLKKYIADSISKHFSSAKYSSFEEKMIGNVFVDGEDVGREFFDAIRIESRYDLIENISISKNSIMSEYLGEILHTYDNQCGIEHLKDDFERVLISLNEEIKKEIPDIELDFEMDDLFKLINKSVVTDEYGKKPEEISNANLLKMFLDTVSAVQRINPTKKLLIFDNIDQLISKEDYIRLAAYALSETSKSDLWVLFFIGTDDYLFTSEEIFQGINVINSEIFSMPEYERMLDFFISEYPRNIDKKEAEVIVRLFPKIIHKIGDSDCVIDIRALVALNLINNSLGIEKISGMNNEIEKEYLFS